jgi:hypothetical protein
MSIRKYNREFNAFAAAKQRCTNPHHPKWKNYGARGIKFCFNNFAEFFAELGPRPSGMTLDRINNDEHYEPGNVRWATQKTQSSNKREIKPSVRSAIGRKGGTIGGRIVAPILNHKQWHVRRGIVNPNCKLCVEAAA